MKIYITVLGEPEVGIFRQYLTVDYPQLKKEQLDEVIMHNSNNEGVTEREFWKEELHNCFSNLFSNEDMEIIFEDEEVKY